LGGSRAVPRVLPKLKRAGRTHKLFTICSADSPQESHKPETERFHAGPRRRGELDAVLCGSAWASPVLLMLFWIACRGGEG